MTTQRDQQIIIEWLRDEQVKLRDQLNELREVAHLLRAQAGGLHQTPCNTLTTYLDKVERSREWRGAILMRAIAGILVSALSGLGAAIWYAMYSGQKT